MYALVRRRKGNTYCRTQFDEVPKHIYSFSSKIFFSRSIGGSIFIIFLPISFLLDLNRSSFVRIVLLRKIKDFQKGLDFVISMVEVERIPLACYIYTVNIIHHYATTFQ